MSIHSVEEAVLWATERAKQDPALQPSSREVFVRDWRFFCAYGVACDVTELGEVTPALVDGWVRSRLRGGRQPAVATMR